MGGIVAEGTLAEVIRQRLGDCSPAERKVARVLLADYPAAGFETVARLAARAGVSGPTVVRFATRLGFQGFPDFQRGLRSETSGTDPAPAARDTPLLAPIDAAAGAMRRTVQGLPPYDVEEAVELLADRRRQVYVAGGSLLAGYLYELLATVRPGVQVVGGLSATTIADLTGRDVLVAFDLPPYEPAVTALARYASRQHAKVVLFTAAGLSPAAAHAEVVLPSESAPRALTPAVALLEAVAGRVLDRLGVDGTQRLTQAEALAAELDGP
ncbi:MurR/RpiR family transcriptional regulator [Cryptosporangium phraense]|uniref:MurR/RpiR family transcriptional regulator n=1 Tax=Cryptosporangium phraense TaxID=2593070 RepID=UPI00197AD770|nr:MurR/RpiR family transcriptional regulator [Cryptosporangium phraense]